MTRDLLWPFVGLLAAHWIADFVLQTHWQASNKSKNLEALSNHITTYTWVLGAASVILFGPMGAPFAAVNGLAHFATDYFTSRASAKLYARGDIHNFFVIVGFDQLIHQVTLAVTMEMFFR